MADNARMNASHDRRTFLKTAVAASALLGAPTLVTMARRAEKGDSLDDALKQAASENKPLVALLVPNTADHGAERDLISAQITDLLASTDKPVRRIFCETVFTCVTDQEHQHLFPDREMDGRAVLLGSDGKPLDEAPFAQDLYLTKFAPSLALLIHGKDDTRLNATAAAQRKALDQATALKLDPWIKDLSDEKFKTRENAAKQLLAIAPRITAILTQALSAEKDSEGRSRLAGIFDKMFEGAAEGKPGIRKPYRFKPVRGRRQWMADPCPACGMGMIWPLSRSFINFLAQ